jgi:predicted RNA binding protein YcfA (HicA-like mRNA interferase family)
VKPNIKILTPRDDPYRQSVAFASRRPAYHHYTCQKFDAYRGSKISGTMAAAAVSNLAGQVIVNALGVQDGFSFGSLASSLRPRRESPGKLCPPAQAGRDVLAVDAQIVVGMRVGNRHRNISKKIYNESIDGKTVISKLKAAGWRLRRISGSHHVMVSADGARIVPVPVHGHRDLKPGTLASIERQAGIKLK